MPWLCGRQAARPTTTSATPCKQKKLDEAIASYRKAIELDPNVASAYHGLGLALQEKGLLEEAIAEYREALRLKPDHAGARVGLAWRLQNLAWALATHAEPARRDPGRAVSLAMEAVELNPQEGDRLLALGAALYGTGRWQDAIETLKRADRLSGGKDHSYNAYFIAMAHWQLGNKEEARRWYDKGRGVDGQEPAEERGASPLPGGGGRADEGRKEIRLIPDAHAASLGSNESGR